jgi:uncharacterized protein YecE (DUF72 family)
MVHIGTSGWNYPAGRGTWNGIFYPSRRPRGFDELAYYAEHFDTVEVNSTFYRMPEAPMSEGWIARTPPDFLFSVKLFQKFTHPDMYLEQQGVKDWDLSRVDLDLFRAGIEPIAAAGRLAAILLQFPPSFHAEPDMRGYLDWLLDGLSEYPLAVELRHRSWYDAWRETQSQLDARRAAWTLMDMPRTPGVVSTEFEGNDTRSLLYIRLHGRNAANWWTHDEAEDRYDYLYSKAELQPFADAARRAKKFNKRVLMYLNNHFSAKAVANAAVLKHELDQLVPGEYPREMVRRYPELEGIVATSGLPL